MNQVIKHWNNIDILNKINDIKKSYLSKENMLMRIVDILSFFKILIMMMILKMMIL